MMDDTIITIINVLFFALMVPAFIWGLIHESGREDRKAEQIAQWKREALEKLKPYREG